MTVELKSGEIYRGRLDESEETMNCSLTDIVCTGDESTAAESKMDAARIHPQGRGSVASCPTC